MVKPLCLEVESRLEVSPGKEYLRMCLRPLVYQSMNRLQGIRAIHFQVPSRTHSLLEVAGVNFSAALSFAARNFVPAGYFTG